MLMRDVVYLPDNNDNFSAIKKKIDASYRASQALWQLQQQEAMIDTQLEAGETTILGGMTPSMVNNNRANYYFNRVRPLLGQVSGMQINNRKSTVVVPLENGDQQTADQWTKILLHLYKKDNVYEKITEAFHQGALMTGMNLLQLYIDWNDDPVFGDIRVRNLAFNQYYIDPYFRELDLSDCSFIRVRSYLPHSVAANLIPEKYDEIMMLPGNPAGMGRDGRFMYMPEASGQAQQNLLSYDEYWYRDFRERKVLIDENTGQYREISQEELDNMDVDLFLADNPQIRIQKQTIPTVRLAIMIQEHVFQDGQNPYGIDRYPFVPVIGYYNKMMPFYYSRLQGLCRSLRDPQMLLNRRIILTADYFESVVNSGFIFKENAIIDVKHLFQTGQGRIIPVKADANLADIQPIQAPNAPEGFFRVQETFSKELNLVSGITEENMGHVVDPNASGFKVALTQGAGQITLRPLFERLDSSQNMLGNIMMDMVRLNYGPVKIRNILEGKEPAPMFYDKAFGKYHCQVENGFNTETQKQMQFAQLLYLRENGVQIPDKNMIEAATIQNKNEITEQMLQQQQQAMQVQQMQAQAALQVQQAQVNRLNASAGADYGLQVERESRAPENHALAAERRAESHRNEQAALLDFVKAVKELQSIDLGHIREMVQISNMMKSQNKAADAESTREAQAETPTQTNELPQPEQQLQQPQQPA